MWTLLGHNAFLIWIHILWHNMQVTCILSSLSWPFSSTYSFLQFLKKKIFSSNRMILLNWNLQSSMLTWTDFVQKIWYTEPCPCTFSRKNYERVDMHTFCTTLGKLSPGKVNVCLWNKIYFDSTCIIHFSGFSK